MHLGKAAENHIISLLLKENRDVYLPVVDDHGVDIIVMTKPSNIKKVKDQYQKIQIKSVASGGKFHRIKCTRPKANYWFVFYSWNNDKIWLINSNRFTGKNKVASKNKGGKNAGYYSLTLATSPGKKNNTAKYIITNFSQLP